MHIFTHVTQNYWPHSQQHIRIQDSHYLDHICNNFSTYYVGLLYVKKFKYWKYILSFAWIVVCPSQSMLDKSGVVVMQFQFHFIRNAFPIKMCTHSVKNILRTYDCLEFPCLASKMSFMMAITLIHLRLKATWNRNVMYREYEFHRQFSK